MLSRERIEELIEILSDESIEPGPQDMEDLGWRRDRIHVQFDFDEERSGLIRVLQQDLDHLTQSATTNPAT